MMILKVNNFKNLFVKMMIIDVDDDDNDDDFDNNNAGEQVQEPFGEHSPLRVFPSLSSTPQVAHCSSL